MPVMIQRFSFLGAAVMGVPFSRFAAA